MTRAYRIARVFVFAFAYTLIAISSSLSADQTAPELPQLFDELQQATGDAEARRIEAEIWHLWLEPPDTDAEKLMAQITRAMSASDLAVALERCNALVESHPNYAEAWNKRATVNYMMGNNAASVADIRETVALEPRHFGAIAGLGLIFLRERNMQAALDAFEQVLEISPASGSATSSVERLRQELGREI